MRAYIAKRGPTNTRFANLPFSTPVQAASTSRVVFRKSLA